MYYVPNIPQRKAILTIAQDKTNIRLIFKDKESYSFDILALKRSLDSCF